MRDFLLGVLAFFLTIAETAVATFEGRADRQATSCPDNRFSKKAAHWATVFEWVLMIDILIIVHSWWMFIPIGAGAWIGKYWAVEQRRKKFRRRTKRKGNIPPVALAPPTTVEE